MLLLIFVVLHYNFVPHFLQILLEHLDISYFFIDVISLDEDDISELIIEHSHERIQLVLINLIVKPLADEPFSVGE